MVVRNLPRRRLLAVCLVCRAWRVIVQRILWEDADYGFLKMLSPTVRAPSLDRYINFVREPSASDWKVFLEKAENVHVLRDPTFGGAPTRLTDAAISVIARSRPLVPIFPHLKVLYMTSLGARKLFMSESVKEFVWRIDAGVVGGEMQSLCEDIVTLMPFIHILKIEVASVPHIENALAWLCLNLRRLRRLVLPLYGLSASLFHKLSTHETLLDIDFERALGEPSGTNQLPSTVAINSFSLSGLTFPRLSYPRLHRLSIALIDFDALFEVLRSSACDLRSLTRLVVRIPYTGLDVADRVYALLKFLSAGTVSLRQLSLYLAPRDGEDVSDILASRRVGFFDLEPILDFRCLEEFSIHLANPLDVNDAELEELAILLPSIRILSLNPHPSLASRSQVTFAALTHFAEWCPDLQDLGLYMDGEVDVERHAALPFGPDFRALRIGRSRLPGPADFAHRRQIAACLGDLLPQRALVLCLFTNDVMDSSDYGPRMPVVGNRAVWHDWNREFRSNWVDIGMLVRAVVEERGGRYREMGYIDEETQD